MVGKRMTRAFLIPAGLKDYLPGEARLKRKIEDIWAQTFRRWSYEEVVTPTLEFFEALTVDGGTIDGDQLHKLIDRQGRILALRPDMTTPIARMVATRLQSAQLPLRLFYLANVFRDEEPQAGRQREFFQGGVELIGVKSPWADAEVIALAVEALLAVGVKDFKIGIGQVEITKGLINQLNLPDDQRDRVRKAIMNKNFVDLDGILETNGVPPERRTLINSIVTPYGSPRVLDQVGALLHDQAILDDVQDLTLVLDALKAYNLSQYVFIDLGILRNFDYYTGIVFEGYVKGIGFPICGGGRYDRLLGKFGFDCPATGFALGLERVMLALEPQEKESVIDYLLIGEDLSLLARKAKELRQKGYTVEVDLTSRKLGEAQEYAARRGIANVLEVGGTGIG